MTSRIVVATGNAHKVEEVTRILSSVNVEFVPLSEFGVTGPPETGETFEDNALLKARAAAAATGLPALADDSGIEVDALRGAPGIHSARFAGPNATDEENNAKLLAEMEGVPEKRRTARFICVAALVVPNGDAEPDERTTKGTMEGRLIGEARGDKGFGYDPLFVARGQRHTNGQLGAPVKDKLSHRGQAFRAMKLHIQELIAGY